APHWPAYPVAYAPPYPVVPPVPRRRGPVVAGVVAALVLVLAVTSATAWWLLRDGAGDNASPLAGRPRVTDGRAGISYAIPEGWERSDRKLIDAFTSSINTKRGTGDTGSMVLAGRSDPVPQADLQRQVERAARSNAVFFYPDGSSRLAESRPTTVSHRPAHTVVMQVNDGRGGSARLRMTLIAASDHASAFLLGIDQPTGPAEDKEVDAVMESATVTRG
ncbi:hypothetical protein K6I34_001481, partial [Streptomyces sp. UNOC14_S4]|nr:hypothetical protein [Streptomyces sp. UNOC14_S4]